MAASSIRNTTPYTITLPSPFNVMLIPSSDRQGIVVPFSAAQVTALLGGSPVVKVLEINDVPAGQPIYQSTEGGNAAKAFLFTAPAAASATGVHASVAGTAANVFAAPFTNPAIPRNITGVFAAGWDGGDLTVVGTDQFDQKIQEVITSPGAGGGTVVGSKCFKTITSARKGAIGINAAGASIGTGTKLGVGAKFAGTFGVVWVDDVVEAVTVNVANSTFAPTTAPNAARNYKLLVNL